MKRLWTFVVSSMLVAALAGCSHGGGSSIPSVQSGGSGTITVGNPSNGGAKTTSAQKMTVSIRVPASLKTSSTQRRTPQYVSPSTLGATITVYGALATPPPTPTVVADLSSSSPLCTPNSDGSRTCNVQVQAPVGNDDFLVNTYDQAPVGGAIPAGANLLSTSTLQYVIQAGQVNTLPLTLNGVPAAIVLGPPGFLVPPNQTSTFTFTVNAKDADGNYIVGPGNYTSPIVLAISGDPNNTISLSTTTITSPATSTVTATYNGGALTGTATITGSAGGATSGSLTVQASSSVTTVTIVIPGFQSEAIWIADAYDTNSVVRFAANASGNATPTQSIAPGLYPNAVAFDSSGYEYVAANSRQINVYAPNSSGNASPVRQIIGNVAGLYCANAVAVSGTSVYVSDCGGSVFVFPASGNGQTAPTAVISGSNTLLTAPNSVAVDGAGDIYVGNGGSSGSVVVFAPGANGNVTPIRSILPAVGGIQIGCCGAQGIAVDSSGTLYVATAGAIDVFGPSDNGAVPADRTITNSAMCGPMGVAVDGLGNVWTSNVCGPVPNQAPLVAFATTASGTATPTAVISGSATGLFNSGNDRIAIDPANNIYTTNTELGTVTEYAAGSNGNAAPTATLNLAQPYMNQPKGIAFDASGNLYVATSGTRTIAVYSAGSSGQIAPTYEFFPQSDCDLQGVAVDTVGNIYVSDECGNNIAVYAAGSNGFATPKWVIQGSSTGLSGPDQIALDSSNNLYVANTTANSITVYAAGVQGDASPLRTIAGSNTGITQPRGIAIDAFNDLYVFSNGASPALLVFGPNASGNVSPVRTITGNNTGLCSCSPSLTGFLAVDSNQNIYVNTGNVRIFGPSANGNVAPYRTISGVPDGDGVGIAISPTQP